MAWWGKTLAIIIVGLLATLILQEWILVPIGIVLLLWLLRKGADMFWWGKDNDKW